MYLTEIELNGSGGWGEWIIFTGAGLKEKNGPLSDLAEI